MARLIGLGQRQRVDRVDRLEHRAIVVVRQLERRGQQLHRHALRIAAGAPLLDQLLQLGVGQRVEVAPSPRERRRAERPEHALHRRLRDLGELREEALEARRRLLVPLAKLLPARKRLVECRDGTLSG